MSIDLSFKMGFDRVVNGANVANCHFTLFSDNEKSKAWEHGKHLAEYYLRKLSSIEMELLNYLVQQAPDYVSPKAIPLVGMENPATVRVWIHRIRAEIGPEHIITSRKLGYKFVLDEKRLAPESAKIDGSFYTFS